MDELLAKIKQNLNVDYEADDSLLKDFITATSCY